MISNFILDFINQIIGIGTMRNEKFANKTDFFFLALEIVF